MTIYVLAPEVGEMAGIIIDFSDSTCGGSWDDAYNSRCNGTGFKTLYFDDEDIFSCSEIGRNMGGWNETSGYVSTDYNNSGTGYIKAAGQISVTNFFTIDLTGLSATSVEITIGFFSSTSDTGSLYMASEAQVTVNGRPSSTLQSASISTEVTEATFTVDVTSLGAFYIL